MTTTPGTIVWVMGSDNELRKATAALLFNRLSQFNVIIKVPDDTDYKSYLPMSNVLAPRTDVPVIEINEQRPRPLTFEAAPPAAPPALHPSEKLEQLLGDVVRALDALMFEYVPDDDSEPDPKTRRVIRECEGALLAAQTFMRQVDVVPPLTGTEIKELADTLARDIDTVTANLTKPLT